MLIVDTEAENIGAISFFQKMGFSNPKSHVYMSSNLSRTRKRNSSKTLESGIKPINLKKNRLHKLLTSLIDIYSPTGKEVEALKYIENYLKRAGFVLERQRVDEERYNLILHSDLKSPQCLFLGHIDTVFAYDYDHYGHQIEGDEIFGLGSSDMKGGCAAMIEAFVSLKEAGADHIPATLAIVVGEEETNDGAIMLSKDHHSPWAIIGEPTDLIPCLSHYSYLETRLTTLGKRMHPSVNGEMAFLSIHSGYRLPDKGRLPEIVKRIYQAKGHP